MPTSLKSEDATRPGGLRASLLRGRSSRKTLEASAAVPQVEATKFENAEVSPDGPVFGSGNFLADRGYPDPDEARLKYLMSVRIAMIADDRGWTQSKVAETTGLAQSDVSRIVNGNVKDFSVWRLMKALNALGMNIMVQFSYSEAENGQLLTDFIEPESDMGQAPAM